MLFSVDSLRFLDWGPISFGLSAGETAAVFGASGSGKSLLLRALADLIPQEGACQLDGRSMRETPAAEWRRKVGFLATEALWWEDRVGDHFPEDVDAKRLAELGLAADAMDWEVTRLSMGERQRLGLMRLLAREPRVLLLDEPSSNLDPESARRAESVIASYLRDRQAAAIWVTHDQAQAERVAQRSFEMRDKQLREVATR